MELAILAAAGKRSTISAEKADKIIEKALQS
jgi:hypothetical protein